MGVEGRGHLCHCSPPSSAVPPLLEKRRQQASDHAAAKKEVQEPNHPGLQDAGRWLHQHGRGEGGSQTVSCASWWVGGGGFPTPLKLLPSGKQAAPGGGGPGCCQPLC